MRSFNVLFLTSILFCADAAGAEASAKLAVPSLGWVYDAHSSTLRPVTGILGAAVLGESVDVGFALRSAAVAGQQGFALGVSAEDGSVRVVSLRNGVAVTSIHGALTAPDHVALSPSGASALLSKTTRVQVITGLPDAPVVNREFAVPEASTLKKALVSDDGTRVLLVLNDDALWMAGENNSLYPLSLQMASAASFRLNEREAIAVTRSGSLYRIDAAGSYAVISTAAAQDGSEAVGVQMLPDGSRAYVAYRNGVMLELHTGSGDVKTIACGCTVTALEPMDSPSTFRINDGWSTPLLLMRGSDTGPRVWFVPADRGER